MAAVPWPIRLAPKDTAVSIFFGSPHSPAWTVKGSPARAALSKRGLNRQDKSERNIILDSADVGIHQTQTRIGSQQNDDDTSGNQSQ